MQHVIISILKQKDILFANLLRLIFLNLRVYNQWFYSNVLLSFLFLFFFLMATFVNIIVSLEMRFRNVLFVSKDAHNNSV